MFLNKSVPASFCQLSQLNAATSVQVKDDNIEAIHSVFSSLWLNEWMNGVGLVNVNLKRIYIHIYIYNIYISYYESKCL